MKISRKSKYAAVSELDIGCKYLEKYLERMPKGGGFGPIWDASNEAVKA